MCKMIVTELVLTLNRPQQRQTSVPQMGCNFMCHPVPIDYDIDKVT